MADSELLDADHQAIIDETNDQMENIVVQSQTKGLEAEDIVADAIHLNVDEDLNEQKYETSLTKSSSFQNGNSLDSANVEDEPNYEIDENDQEQYLNEQNSQQNQKSNYPDQEPENVNQDHKNESESQEKNTKDDSSNNVHDDDVKKDSTENQKHSSEDVNGEQNLKATENKTNANKASEETNGVACKKDVSSSTKESDNKKESSKNHESNSKASKSKSSSSKDKSTEHKSSSSNDKVLWVSGLSSNAKASDLQSLFKKHGKVVSAKIIKNNKLSGSKLFGVITMENVEHAEKCIQNLNKKEFNGKTITVEKNRFDDKKSSDGKHNENRKEKKDIERKNVRSPRNRRSFSPIRRFPLPGRPVFPPIRRGASAFRPGRGGFRASSPPFRRAPFVRSNSPILLARKLEAERLMRRRQFREQEFRDRERSRREEDDYRRQKDLERKQQEERDKLEREKMKLKIERERLEREKVEFLRAEREKARIERERLEREKEEFRRKQQQLPSVTSSRLDDRSSKRGYDDLYSGWDDRKRGASFATSTGNSTTASLATSARYELESGLGGNSFANFPTYLLGSSNVDLVDRRKLDVALSTAPSSSLQDSNRSSSGYDRDDRRQQTNGSSGLGNSSTSRSSLSTRDRESRRDRDDWKSADVKRSDANLATSQSSYLSSATRSTSGYDRPPDSWATAPDRMPAASSLRKFSSFSAVSAINDRNRTATNLNPSVMGSTIGMYNPAQISGLISSPGYNNNLVTGHRRY